MQTHVVFGESIAGTMKLLGLPDPVMALEDDLSCGPLGDMLSEATREDRVEWWSRVLVPSQPRYLQSLRRSWERVGTWLHSGGRDDAVVIWVAENPAELTGASGILAHLPMTAPVSIINVNQAYARVHDTAEVQSLIKYTGEIIPDELPPLMDHAVPLSPTARYAAIAQWHRLVESGGHLRQIVNAQVATAGVDYLDPFIVEQAQALLRRQERLRAVRLVGECLGWHPQVTSDALIFWRIRCLIESGVFTYTGSLKSMRDCFLQLAGN
ncbi:DUF3658 domain-containing protein [Sulfobacillus harzensis]|uniref:DUF1835 domain-containing protein n=1 Tax=Sulfobacillus harzensis TaxID=2729629 RepID=A0A7Y0L3K9_9FIRM|nr:DUF3658 domain-containing protein [Sulfobacillus harzensis]NMP22694.1 DUF1835 domain-containing protein [Sulfobacillus harzensis]